MKKYIKPDIEIIHAAPANLMGISDTKLNSSGRTPSVIHNDDTQGDKDISIIAGDVTVDGDITDAAKRNWNIWDVE